MRHLSRNSLILALWQLQHSCDPSVRPSFPEGTNELHLVAAKPIKKGDELTMAYVDVKPAEDVVEARRLRRQEIARGWRFACECTKCKEEAPAATGDTPAPADDVKIEGPGAQVDEAVQRYESGDHVPPSEENTPDVE
jgi:mitochondrial import receptor subunit TOM20